MPDKSIGLDTQFPYPWRAQVASGKTGLPFPYTGDSRTTFIRDAFGEKLWSFSAIMYLMWDPALPDNFQLSAPAPTSCHAAHTDRDNSTGNFTTTDTECKSIPVPLANLKWGFKDCGINTLNPSGGTNLDAQGKPGGEGNGSAFSMACSATSGGPYGTVLIPSAANGYSFPQWGTVITGFSYFDQATGAACQ
jgi:hypothetical protein